ncbi:hypothetical protein ABFG95_16840 [Achromobacter sp. HNDS-1]|jgi:hypothetical protein|uniref:Lipoprotein n=2 Tax=Achromobacter TaxID=222 RepID=A0A2M9GTK1_9BURK|nr:hypothetical protein [Achromobacter ruhlandii]MCI1838911.1 hypothetical protein [Achromobacter ruhlandii]PJM67908.1 hypothetical protein CV751_22250 [Achromobacter ruhlandii]CAB3844670.1 hypothetical protein LMG3328_01459 [Achromobacter ruhlandii]
MLRHLLAIALFFSLAGCGTTLKPVKPNAQTGLFPTTVAVTPSHIQVAEPFNPAYRHMAFLKFNADRPNPQFVAYFQTSIKNMEVFEQVVTKAEIEPMIIEKQLQEKVTNVSDLLGLNLLSKQIGNFLIIDVDSQWKGSYNFESTLQAIDASTGKTMFKSSVQAFNWDGLDVPMFRPMLNAFVLWTKDKLPSAQASAATATTGPAAISR